jgi:hypothetical protein
MISLGWVMICLAADGASGAAAPSAPNKVGQFVELDVSARVTHRDESSEGHAVARVTVTNLSDRRLQVTGLGTPFEVQLPDECRSHQGQLSVKTIDGRSIEMVCESKDHRASDGPRSDACFSSDPNFAPVAGLVSFSSGGAGPSGFGGRSVLVKSMGEGPRPKPLSPRAQLVVLKPDDDLADVLADHLVLHSDAPPDAAKRATGTLTPVTEPPGLLVLLGDAEIGTTAFVNKTVPAGRQVFKLFAPSGDTRALPLDIKPGQLNSARQTFESLAR